VTDHPPPNSGRSDGQITDDQKRAAAVAAAALVEDGMYVGLGTGSTVAYLMPALAARDLKGMHYTASSPATATAATAVGLTVHSPEELNRRLDIVIDGADQIAPDGWLIKGGGAAHTREKILAAAAARFVVIASAEKAVASLHAPVPVEILHFGATWTLEALAPAKLRDCPPSPDGNLIADYLGAIDDPAALASRLASTAGVVEHGLFAPGMVSDILIAGPSGVTHRSGAKAPA
jgi:ribose 5-phosphate isomerase A